MLHPGQKLNLGVGFIISQFLGGSNLFDIPSFDNDDNDYDVVTISLVLFTLSSSKMPHHHNLGLQFKTELKTMEGRRMWAKSGSNPDKGI